MADTVLWYRDLSSDKLWGIADYQGRAITFWGKRGGKLDFKLLNASEQKGAEKKADKKRRDGYRDTSFEELEVELPGFKNEFDYQISMAILGDGFRYTSAATLAGK
jgi:predicted DNA-binding WGR domain protein